MPRARQPDERAQALVEMELNERYGDLRHPVLAAGMCIRASKYAGGRYMALKACSQHARAVCATKPLNVDGPGTAWGHVALLIGRTIYDYTARQFWVDTPWPLIEPVEAWAERYDPAPELTDMERRVWYPGRVTTHGTWNPRIIVPYPKVSAECSSAR